MKKTILILLIISFNNLLYANMELPNSAYGIPKMFQNSEYLKSLETAINYSRFDNQSQYDLWNVFIDSDNIKSYTASNNTIIHKDNFKFLESFYIAKIENNRALIYKGGKINGLKIDKKGAKSYGWVELNDLLLWKYCPKTQNKVYMKALILRNINKSGSRTNTNKFYSSSLGNQLAGVNSPQDLEIYYVYKIKDKRALLFTSNHFSDGMSLVQAQKGWIDETEYMEWNQRVCLERAYGKKTTSYNFTANIYEKREEAKAYSQNGNIYSAKFEEKRMDPNKPRFPIISSEGGVDKCATIASTNNKKIDEKSVSDIKTKLTKLKDQLKIINVVFVVDATQSMREYYQPIASGIQTSMANFNKEEQNRFHFGAVVYRDHCDEKTTEKIKTTTNYKDVSTWLTSREIKSASCDKDLEEEMFEGIKVAITEVGIQKESTNFIILIGDAGNRKDDKKQDEIINLLKKYNINFISIQAKGGDIQAFRNFREQISSLAKSRIDLSKYEFEVADFPRFYQIKKKDNNENPFFNYSAYLFTQTNNNKENVTPTTTVKKIIEKQIRRFYDYTTDQIERIDSESTQARTSGKMTPEFRELLKRKGWKDDEIEGLKQRVLTVEGYTILKHDNKNIFNPVLYLSYDELNTLIKDLKKVNNITTENRRGDLQKALKTLCKTYIGQQDLDIEVDDLIKEMLGVSHYESPLKKVKLKDIVDKRKVTDAEIDDFINIIDKSCTELEVYKTDKDYKFEENECTYYWIPLDFIQERK